VLDARTCAAPNDRGAAPVAAGPVAPAERIGVLDVLRGLALVGMYVVHFNYYEATPAELTASHPIAGPVAAVIGLFFESRFHAIFGMRFGVGFAVQLSRADARGERFAGRYLRRLLALAVFGIIAEAVFGYNVLFGYAMWGVPLLLVRRWPVRWLVPLVVVCAASVPLYNLGRIAVYSQRPDGMAQFQAANEGRNRRFFAAQEATGKAEEARMGHGGRGERAYAGLPPAVELAAGRGFTLFLLGMIAFRRACSNARTASPADRRPDDRRAVGDWRSKDSRSATGPRRAPQDGTGRCGGDHRAPQRLPDRPRPVARLHLHRRHPAPRGA
jgi:uncharacterized membrane protein YeiB